MVSIKYTLNFLVHVIKYSIKTVFLIGESIALLIKYQFWKWFYCIFTPKDIEYLDDIPKIQKIHQDTIQLIIKIGLHKNDLPSFW